MATHRYFKLSAAAWLTAKVSSASADGGDKRRAADVELLLEDSDDVQNVYTNIDVSDEVLAALDEE